MADIKENKKTSQPRGSGGKKVTPDYAARPQRPITLKSGVRTPPVLKKEAPSKKQAKPKKRSSSTATEKKAKKAGGTSTANQWILRGISPATKNIALTAAKQEGIKVSEWLENVIDKSTQPDQQAMRTSPEETHLLTTLKSIDERLQRLEQQKGFWARFWDQFMEQSKQKG
ncbi:MAG: hypothetical protein KZQ77_10910 [Candidatus Thiodiazotropha sp. (ex Notomyrtea botanica)]|nr:hypothetical protein [Candidatus Thiodiazotropha sp. (ex Notomyrtea botanica)]